MRWHVPLGLGLILVRIFWIAAAPGQRPYVDIGQLESSPIPSFAWGLAALAVWAGYGIALARTVRGGPKRLYLAGHWSAVALSLVAPAWGLSALAAMHGLEYVFLTWRMLQPRENESGGWLVPAVALTLAPMLLAGLLTAPFLSLREGASRVVGESATSWVLITTNAVVVAHYFADAFLYRFRIPRVRQVMLERLGLA